MKQSLPMPVVLGLLTCALLFSFTPVELPADGSPKDVMIADWERAKAFTKEYLDAATDEVIAFKPADEMRTFGEQMLHLAEANYGFTAAGTGKTSPVAPGALSKAHSEYNTKDKLTQVVMASYDFVIAALKEMDESKMNETIKLFNRFDVTRESALQKAFEHQTHHRGQTTIYLRLKGIKPPNEKLF